MSRQPCTAAEVVHYWVETQIGNRYRLMPKGFDRIESSGASADTRARAASLVASFPLYAICRPHLIEWCQVGSSDHGLVGEFLHCLEEHLQQYPFYPTTARDMEAQAKLPVKWLTVDEASEKLGVTKDSLRVRLDRSKVSLPFGTFKFERKWNVHPMDLEALRQSC